MENLHKIGKDSPFNFYSLVTYRKKVWIYDPQNGFARTQGPSLTQERHQHSCSTMNDGKKTLIVVAGGYAFEPTGILDSVEIYDPTDKTWHSGKTNSQLQNTFYLLFSNQNKSKCTAATTKIPKFDIKKRHNLKFFPLFYIIY